jgi:protein-S-isoprenylcysteine O-methyltransferase Ste14
MPWSHPVSMLQLGLFWVIMTIGAISLVQTLVRSRGPRDAARKSRQSMVGIGLQMIGFFAAGLGPIRIGFEWTRPGSIASTIAVLVFGGAALATFAAASAAMGKNWSIVARVRSDHELVRSGPFAIVRHPIYLALLLYLLAMAVAFGHFAQLLVAVPVYCAGTIVRIREEEKLLRAQFGDAHARYVREVPAFIPFVG